MRAAKRDAKIAEAEVLRPKRARVAKPKPFTLRSLFSDYLGLPGAMKPADRGVARMLEASAKKTRRRQLARHQRRCDQRFYAGRLAANKERDPKQVHPRHLRSR